MATESAAQLVAYHAFVKTTLSKGGSIDEDATPQAFLEYQRQLSQLREALRPAVERFQHGDVAEEIDIEQFVEEVIREASQPSEQR